MAGTISPGLQVGTAPRGDLKAEVARVKPARSHGRSTLEKKKKMGRDPRFSVSISSSLLSAPQGTGTSDKIFQFIFRGHSAPGMGAELPIGAQ